MSERTAVWPPRDRETAETIKDELVDLRESRAYQLVMDRLEQLVSQDLRSLEKEESALSVRHLQGRVASARQVKDLITQMIHEIDNFDYAKERALNSG